MLIDVNIGEYYNVNFQLMDALKMSLQDIESLLPFEREMYMDLFIAKMERVQRENKTN